MAPHLPPNLAAHSRHYDDLHGLCIVGRDGNIRDEYFYLYRDRFPVCATGWDVSHLSDVFWDMELQQMYEGVFTMRYVVTALLNFHKKMLLWNDPGNILLSEEHPGSHQRHERILLPDIADLVMLPCIVEAMMEGEHPFSWPDPWDERRRLMPYEVGLVYDTACLDKLDDIMRVNGLEGSDVNFYNFPTPRDIQVCPPLGTLAVEPPTEIELQQAKVPVHLNADDLAHKSVVRPTTRIKRREECFNFYPPEEMHPDEA